MTLPEGSLLSNWRNNALAMPLRKCCGHTASLVIVNIAPK
jgi:hypothetical protein